jgi:deoxyribodipyrimidine photolyase-like uncharacterized protein
MRRAAGLLTEQGGEPFGGRWNFETENRKPVLARLDFPPAFLVRSDAISRRVSSGDRSLKQMSRRFKVHESNPGLFDRADDASSRLQP